MNNAPKTSAGYVVAQFGTGMSAYRTTTSLSINTGTMCCSTADWCQ